MSLTRLAAATLLSASLVPLTAQTTVPRAAAPRAELIVTNARIYTADDAQPLAEAMAVSGGKLLFVGSAVEAMALRGATTTVLDVAVA